MELAQENSVQVLSKDEEKLYIQSDEWLKDNKPQDYELFQSKFHLLRALGKAVFDYPSVKNTWFLKDVISDDSNLSASLLNFSASNHLLRNPSKVTAIRSFLVAKFHSFSLLCDLTEDNIELHVQAKNITFSVVFTLMAEEVYFSCLEDKIFSNKTISRLTDDLIALWDSGIDTRSVVHLMALSSLWTARDMSPPVFGTMDGNSEILRLSFGMENGMEWEDFLVNESCNDDTRWALEEFIFGLSFEEIQQVRSRLRRYGISTVNHDEIRSYLSSNPVYSLIDNHDPREIYDFFMERRDSCMLRKKLSMPGPKHTLEEIYLKYRIVLESNTYDYYDI